MVYNNCDLRDCYKRWVLHSISLMNGEPIDSSKIILKSTSISLFYGKLFGGIPTGHSMHLKEQHEHKSCCIQMDHMCGSGNDQPFTWPTMRIHKSSAFPVFMAWPNEIHTLGTETLAN